MQKLILPDFPSQYLECYASALISILKYMGLSKQIPLLGTQTYFVLWSDINSISSRFNWIDDEWERIHGLVSKTIPILNHTDLTDKIISKIQSGLPVCLPLDIYFLPHTSHHNSLHQIHFINIFGYDDKQYYMVCPYYRFKGWVAHDLIHTAFFAPITEKKELIFIPELKVKILSHENVHQLIQESCQYMLGLAIPEELAHFEPQYLGLAGIRTFSDHLKKITDGHGSYTAANMQNLSREIMTIGYSRYWFDKLSHVYLQQTS